MRARTAMLLILVVLFAPAVFGWGRDGHQIVALVAQATVKQPTDTAIKALLGNQTLADIAPVLDAALAP